MFKLLIFGGTTEGRKLAEFCSANKICADVSVATDYGALLLPENINIFLGKLNCSEMTKMMMKNNYHAVIDATHPYAQEATCNIKKACENSATRYYRLLRDRSELYGETAENVSQAVEILNQCDSVVLSTLGSNCAEQLTGVKNFRERIWLRILPISDIKEHCIQLGFDENKIICEKGPFTVEQNVCHIKKSGAKILVTKESGKSGGYAEKADAVRRCGIKMITIIRPDENGLCYEEIIELIKSKAKGAL